MTVTLPCHTCSSAVAQGLTSVTCYAQVHSGEHSRTVVHRVGLFNKTGHITNIITQSDVVRWLQQQQGSLGELKNMTAHQLGWAGKHIKSLPARTPAIEVSLSGCVCTRLEAWHADLRPDSGAGCTKTEKTLTAGLRCTSNHYQQECNRGVSVRWCVHENLLIAWWTLA